MPSPNYWSGRPEGAPLALVVHTMDGTLGATDSWFANPASQVSAHFGVGLDGALHQYVQLGDSAWANGILEAGNLWQAHGLPNTNPNYLTVSIETEDLGLGTTPVSSAEYAGALALGRLAQATYPSLRFLLRHTDISPQSRPDCPGDRWVASGRFAALAEALGLTTLL